MTTLNELARNQDTMTIEGMDYIVIPWEGSVTIMNHTIEYALCEDSSKNYIELYVDCYRHGLSGHINNYNSLTDLFNSFFCE